jgi:hypothetical protein
MDNLVGFFSSFNTIESWHSLLDAHSITELSTTLTTSYVLIIAAEMGDKSQLVCMTLASRHRATPVILGAITAFALLNTLAVVFGVVYRVWHSFLESTRTRR